MGLKNKKIQKNYKSTKIKKNKLILNLFVLNKN